MPPAIPPERWSSFPAGGTLFVQRPAVKKGDRIRFSEMTCIDVPVGATVLVLLPDELRAYTDSNPEKT